MTDDREPEQMQLKLAPGSEVVAEGVEVEPQVLVWARKSIGLDIERAARKVGVVQKTLEKWESGAAAPTLPQLRRWPQLTSGL